MNTRKVSSALSRHDSSASRREQALCRDALDSGEYDELSDQQWVAMCERIGRDPEADGADGLHESESHSEPAIDV